MTRRVLPVAVLAVLASAALAQAASAPTITIGLHPRVLPYTRTVHIRGTVSTHSKRRVVLDVSHWPFHRGLGKAASATTDSQGNYDFHGAPALADRLRVRTKDGSARSKRVTVYVVPLFTHTTCSFETPTGERIACSDSGQAHGKLKLHFGYHLSYPGDAYAKESAKRVYFYYGQRNGSSEHPDAVAFRKTVKQHGIGHHRTAVHVTLTVHAPSSGAWAGYVVGCTRWSFDADGFGLPRHHGCGDPTVSYSQATAKTFG